MKMTILELGCCNIRKLSKLQLKFYNNNETIKNSFIMMANGTGKTTIIQLMKSLLEGSLLKWNPDKIKEYAPTINNSEEGEFYLTVKFDDTQYKYIAKFDFKNGKAKIETVVPHKGLENGLKFPESIKSIFTPEFVSRFIFDGEQAKKSMDSTSNEAEETIRYLNRLDELDLILGINDKILFDIQNAEGANVSKGSDRSLKSYLTKKTNLDNTVKKLETEQKSLHNELKILTSQLSNYKSEETELASQYDKINDEKLAVEKDKKENIGAMNSQILSTLQLIKLPYLVCESFYDRMKEIGFNMQELKLPKNSSKEFFKELANEEKCICGREIGEYERSIILQNSEKYLGGEQQAILNVIKEALKNIKRDESYKEAFESIIEINKKATIISNRERKNNDDLLKAGGDRAEKIKSAIDEINKRIGSVEDKLKTLESREEYDEKLTENNNLFKARLLVEKYEKSIASLTKTNDSLHKKNIIEKIVNNIKTKATAALKSDIIKKTNDKIKNVIFDDNIEIKNIDHYIKLKDRNGASEGQTLSIGYCFLGTLFENAELEFPFIIDSPTGKMDFDKRKAVATIIQKVFKQMVSFVQSAEVDNFADKFYDREDTQFLTVISSKEDGNVDIKYGKEFFDTYQKQHKGDEE